MPSAYYHGYDEIKFSTFDMDNDWVIQANCASDSSGGWWFSLCSDAYLNGPWSYGTFVWSSQYWSMKEVNGTLMSIKYN